MLYWLTRWRMITNYLFGCIWLIWAHILGTSWEEFLFHCLICSLFIELELKCLRIQLFMSWLLIEILIKLLCIDRKWHGSHILINKVIIFRIIWILQIVRIVIFIKILCLPTTSEFSFVISKPKCISIISVITNQVLSLLHIRTCSKLHIIDAITNTLLLHNLSVWFISIWLKLSVRNIWCVIHLALPYCFWLSSFKNSIFTLLLFSRLLHSLKLLLLI